MNSKLVILACVLFSTIALNAQVLSSGFEDWTGSDPDGWKGVATHTTNLSIVQSLEANSGDYACQLVTSGTSHRRFSSQPFAIESGTAYDITFWAKGTGEVRTGLYRTTGNVYQAYNDYIQLTDTWTEYTQTVVAGGSGTGEIIFSVFNSAAPDHILLDDVLVTEGSIDQTPIYDIQFTTNPSGDSPMVGQAVTISGIVTGVYTGSNNGFFVQDDVGAWNGIHVFMGTSSDLPSRGDNVTVIGSVTEYFNLTQIANVSSVIVNSSGNAEPEATVISSNDVNLEEYEGVLVKIEDTECTETNSGFGMWTMNDGSGQARVHDLMYSYTPSLGSLYSIQGVVNYAFEAFRVCPRDANDIQVIEDNTSILSIYDIQFTTDPSGSSPEVDNFVTTSGIVTGIWPGDGFFIQDGNGPWSAIFVYNNNINPSLGDSIVLTGRVVEYFGFTQLSNISNPTIVSSEHELPAPLVLPTNQVGSEQYESVLVRVENVICTNANAGFGSFDVNDGSGAVNVAPEIYEFNATQGSTYFINGHVFYSFGSYKMLPRFNADIQTHVASIYDSQLDNLSIFPNPAVNELTIQGAHGANYAILDAQGKIISADVLTDDTQTIDVTKLESGIYFINFEGVKTYKFVIK